MESKWQISKEVLSSRIDEEVVLMSIEADSYFGLDPIGSRVWELLSQKPATLSELVHDLLEEYEIDEEACTRDVSSFLHEMSEKKLITQTS